MSSKTKDILYFVLTFLGVFILPYLHFYYFDNKTAEIFYSRIDRDHEKCLERAERDAAYTDFCDRIKDAAEDTFSLSTRSNNFYLLIFPPVLFFLIITVRNLRKEIVELKEKLNA